LFVGVIMGALSVGSALALLMLPGNAYGAYDFYPPSVAMWADATVRGANAPQFDGGVIAAAMSAGSRD
jgi:hypothetical protein